VSRSPGASAFERTLDRIGTDIVDGGLPAGTVCTVDELVDRSGYSRSVVREATRVLSGMGLLASKAHVGHTVQPSSSWDWLQPRVLRWALASGRRESTARLAAERRSDEDARELRVTSEALRAAAVRQDPTAFLEADLLLHRLIRRAAANPILDRVGDAVDEALRDRVGQLPGDGIDHHDAALHTDLASAIEAQDGERAAATMRVIILRTA
jgi:DNA-binding FadR family transcriptional regulator